MSDSQIAAQLAALNKPAAPKMTRIPMARESAQLDSPAETAERLINLFIEQAPAQGRADVIIRSTPGLDAGQSFGIGPVHAMQSIPGRVYTVSGTRLYRQTGSNVVDDMGDVGSPSTSYSAIITIAIGATQVVVCVPPRAYAANINETTFHQITGTTDQPFPGASSVTYIDGYFVFTADENSSRFFSTPPFQPDTYDGLDFAYADGQPNVIRRVVTHLGRLWFFGEGAVEIWRNSGDADFPFRRDAGGVIPYGCLSGRSVAICDGSVFWLGPDRIVYRSNGYQAERVSTHAIEDQIQRYDPSGSAALSVACAFSYSYDGHAFYVLTMVKTGDLGRTWVYDCATKLWHERSSYQNGAGRWRPSSAVLSGLVQLGDSLSGSVFSLNPDSDTEDGVKQERVAITPPIWANTYRAFMDRLELELELGGPSITVSWSDDGAITWKGGRIMSLTGPRRAYTTRLGSFRERTLKFQMQGRVRMYAVDAQLTGGNAG